MRSAIEKEMIEMKDDAKSWRELYPVHPCADVFPMMTDTELAALAADIKANGLQRPVLLMFTGVHQYAVLDGRNRLEALVRLGIEIPTSPTSGAVLGERGISNIFELQTAKVDPATFVISANIHRRHLTKEQQAELILKTVEAGRPKNDQPTVSRSFNPTKGKRGGSTKDPVMAAAIIVAEKNGISRGTVKNARAKLQGKALAPRKKVGVSSLPPTSEARPLGTPSSSTTRPPITPPSAAATKARLAADGMVGDILYADIERALNQAASTLSADEQTRLFEAVRLLLLRLGQEGQARATA